MEKTQWSPKCRIMSQGQERSGQTFSRAWSSTLRPWTLSLTLACLATLAQVSASFSKSRLCRVRRPLPRVGSCEMQGKRDQCPLRPIVFAIPERSSIRAGHRIHVVGMWGDKARLLEDRGPSLGGTLSCYLVGALQSWLNLANSLMTKERPYVVRSSFGAIWTGMR